MLGNVGGCLVSTPDGDTRYTCIRGSASAPVQPTGGGLATNTYDGVLIPAALSVLSRSSLSGASPIGALADSSNDSANNSGSRSKSRKWSRAVIGRPVVDLETLSTEVAVSMAGLDSGVKVLFFLFVFRCRFGFGVDSSAVPPTVDSGDLTLGFLPRFGLGVSSSAPALELKDEHAEFVKLPFLSSGEINIPIL